MRLHKCGHFADDLRGNGWFVSFATSFGWVLFAVRPLNWRLTWLRLPTNPLVSRLYLGPFELQVTNLKRALQ